jgi:hypothetical protein
VANKIDKHARLDKDYKVKLDIKGNRKACAKFFQDVGQYQMPEFDKLMITGVNKVDLSMLSDFNKFLSYSVGSPIQELYFETLKRYDICHFSQGLEEILKRVKKSCSFKMFNLKNDDMSMIFDNLHDAEILEFNECDIEQINCGFKIRSGKPYKLEKIKFSLSTSKLTEEQIYRLFTHLTDAMLNTNLVQVLKEVHLVSPVLNTQQIQKLLNGKGFSLKRVKSEKVQDILVF